MRLLLDTCALIWIADGSTSLGHNARAAYLAEESEVLLSIVSVWEMAIKIGLGKLDLGRPLEDFVREAKTTQRIRLLPIELPHVLRVQTLPFHHRDPFDRLLIAQALEEDLHLVTCDDAFRAYEVATIW